MGRIDHSKLVLAFVVITGMVLSTMSGLFLYKVEERAIIAEFQSDVDERAASLYRELVMNFETLRSLAILFNGNAVPEWHQFSIEAKKILSRHHDIQALEWIPRIAHSERSAYESIQLQGLPAFEILERQKQGSMIIAGERPEYYPVYFVEPLIGNEAAYGFDLASNPIRLKTLEKSRDNAMPEATASIILVQERQNQKGFLAFLPIYKGSSSTVVKRRDELMGFVVGVYRISDIFSSSALSRELQGIEIKLVDETLVSSQDVLHINHSGTQFEFYKNMTYRKELPEILGRKWSLIAAPSSNYFSARRDMLPLAVFVSFVMFTIYIAVYIRLISKRAALAQRLVDKKTHELNEANKNLELLSRSDGLTGIANRRFMDEFIEREWLRAIRNESSIAFIIIDIDFFKLYNDNYGHPEGDDCLKRVATKLKSLIRRPVDLVARYGGEEFALVLPDTKEAKFVANQCRQAIEELQIPHAFSQNSTVVTISVGLCTFSPIAGSYPRLVIEAADKALYKAKEKGRNTVEEIVLEVREKTDN